MLRRRLWRCSAPRALAAARGATKGSTPEEPFAREAKEVAKEVKDHVKRLQKPRTLELKDWRGEPAHRVPHRFRLQIPQPRSGGQQEAGQSSAKKPQEQVQTKDYSNFVGLRFPTLETAENYDYHKDRGLDRIVERGYPIKVPAHRRLDPYLREYIHFLHDLDPTRFTIARIAQRYRLREKTVTKVVQEWGTNRYLTRSGLTKLGKKQVTKEQEILRKKEEEYAKWVGWDQLGDEDEPESDDEALGEFKGWRSTFDWVRRQSVEVESMSAFPMMEKRDPMPKRVDVDLVVASSKDFKIMNWIDPNDKVVF